MICSYQKLLATQCLKYLVKCTTSKSSFLVTQYFLLALVKLLLGNAITFSRQSWTCDKTAPTAVPLASVSKMNDLVKSGWAKTGAVVRQCFSLSNAFWQSTDQLKIFPFSVSLCRGLAISEKFAIYSYNICKTQGKSEVHWWLMA